MRKLLFVSLLLILVSLGFKTTNMAEPPVAEPSISEAPTYSPITIGEIEAEVNRVRVQTGAGEIPLNRLLNESAQARAEELCAKNNWSHDGWTDSLTYPHRIAGENLEYGNKYQTAGFVVKAWVESPSHYSNMINPDFTEQGVGVKLCALYQGKTEAVIVVNHFGVPR